MNAKLMNLIMSFLSIILRLLYPKICKSKTKKVILSMLIYKNSQKINKLSSVLEIKAKLLRANNYR